VLFRVCKERDKERGRFLSKIGERWVIYRREKKNEDAWNGMENESELNYLIGGRWLFPLFIFLGGK